MILRSRSSSWNRFTIARSTPRPTARLRTRANVPTTTPIRVSAVRTFCCRIAEKARPHRSAARGRASLRDGHAHERICPSFKPDDAVGGLAGQLLIVRDHDQGRALAAEVVEQQGHDLGGRGRVEVARRLVRQQDLGPIHQRPRDGDPLVLAAGELHRPMPQPSAQPDRLERRGGRRATIGHWTTRQHHRQLDVLERRPRRDQVIRLEDHPDGRQPIRGELIAGHPGQVAAARLDAPRGRTIQAPDQVQERRLPRARFSQQRHPLAPAHLQRDAPQRDDRAMRSRSSSPRPRPARRVPKRRHSLGRQRRPSAVPRQAPHQ